MVILKIFSLFVCYPLYRIVGNFRMVKFQEELGFEKNFENSREHF